MATKKPWEIHSETMTWLYNAGKEWSNKKTLHVDLKKSK